MDQTMGVENLQILSDGDLRSVEFPSHIHDQHPSIAVKDFNNCPAAFFVEHVSSEHELKSQNQQLVIALSFYIVCFRLSSVMC